MGKLRTMSGADARRVLEQNGFSMARQRGSHMIMQRKTGGSTITVPVPDHRELKAGTLSSIVRQSQLPRELFEAPE